MKRRSASCMVAMGVVALVAAAASGAVVLRNAPWAGASLVTNGMGAAHNVLPHNVTNFTVEAWVKPTAKVGASGNFIFSIIKESGGNGRIVFTIVNNELRCYYYGSWYQSNTSVALDEWSHVAAVRSPDGFDFYINGEHVGETVAYKDAETTKTAEVTVTAIPAIGCQRTGVNNANAQADTGNRVFQGSISDVRFWTEARTEAEIAAGMGTRLAGTEENLHLYVPFTDGTAGESVVKNWAEGTDLTVPPTQELAWDADIDAKFGAAAAPPWGPAPAVALTSFRYGRAKALTDVTITNTTYTLETWARLTAIDGNRTYLLGQYVSGDQATWVGLALGGNSLKPQFFIGSGSNQPVTSDTGVTLGQWFHVAGTRDAEGTVRLYLNGVEVGRGTRDASFGPPPRAFVELFNVGGNASLCGSLREARIWERALPAAEIAARCTQAAAGTEEGLLGCWALDEGRGPAVSNKVTGAHGMLGRYANDGTLERVNEGFTWAPTAALASTSAANASWRIQTDVKITTVNYTVEAWGRLHEDVSGLRYMMGQYKSGDTVSWFSIIFNGNNRPGFRLGSGGTGVTIYSGTAVEPGNWFHVAATRDGTDMKLYLNGEQVAAGTANTELPPPDAAFQLFTTGGNPTWGGDLREARVWNCARTQAQIAEAMNDPAEGTEDGLLGCWPLDEGTGTSVVNKKTGQAHACSKNNSWLEGQSSAPTLSAPGTAPFATELAPEFGGAWFGVARTETAIDVGDFTMETWVRPTAWPWQETYLLSQWQPGEEQSGDAHNPNRFLMGLTDTDHFGLFIGDADESGNAGGWRSTDETVPLDEWTHLAATRQGSTLRLYINGQLKKTVTGYTTRSPWNADKQNRLTLGGTDSPYLYDLGRMLQGSMREVRVWNRALNPVRIANIYNHKVDVADEGNLIGYWPLAAPDGNDPSRLVNEAAAGGGETGYVLVGWSRRAALNLAAPEPPRGTLLLMR